MIVIALTLKYASFYPIKIIGIYEKKHFINKPWGVAERGYGR
jgi:hypothetical protein